MRDMITLLKSIHQNKEKKRVNEIYLKRIRTVDYKNKANICC